MHIARIDNCIYVLWLLTLFQAQAHSSITPGTTAFIQLLLSVPGEMIGDYLYCQVMRKVLLSSGINRYSRRDLAFPNVSFPTPSPFLHVPLWLLLCLYKSSALFSLLFQTLVSHSFFLIASLMFILFFILSNSKIEHFSPLIYTDKSL